ncbi:MAG: YgzB family protein [Nitrospira sp.]|nr:YgzB family protein [Nitrospira sp.]
MSWNTFFVVALVLLTVSLVRPDGPKRAFYLMTALLPATGFFVDVGISLSASKVIGLILSMFLLRFWVTHGVSGKAQSLGFVFLIYAAVVTITGWLFAPVSSLESNEFRVLMRPAVQWLALTLQMLPLFLAPHILRSKADVAATVKAFFWGSGLLALGGVLQWAVYSIWAVDIFPINREGLFGDVFESSGFEIGEDIIFRAKSLAREPKDMGTALVIAFTIWLLLRSAGMIRSFALSCVFVGTLLMAIVFSFSTTASFLLCVGVVALFIASITRVWIGSRKATEIIRVIPVGHAVLFPGTLMKPAATVLFLGMITLASFLWYDSIQGLVPFISDIVALRVGDRIGVIEDYDQVALDFLMNEPHWGIIGVGAGNLPWYGFSYLPSDPDSYFMQNLSWNAKSGLLLMVTSYGLMGLVVLILILGAVVAILLAALHRCKNAENLPILVAIISVGFISTVHAFRSVDETFWLALGLAVAYARTHSTSAQESQPVCSQTVAQPQTI